VMSLVSGGAVGACITSPPIPVDYATLPRLYHRKPKATQKRRNVLKCRL
jgi:hypothetical protein